MNNQGDVAGYSDTATGQTHAFAILGGTMMDLDVPGSAASRAVGINDSRQVLIVSEDAQKHASSLIWQNGQSFPIPSLSGSDATGGAINNLGQVVGNGMAADGTNHAFAYDPAALRLIDMGEIGPGSALSHVNEIGQAVGTRITPYGYRIAFGADIRKESSFLSDLLVDYFLDATVAYWINNRGLAVGDAVPSDAPGTVAGLWTLDDNFWKLNQALVAGSGWTMLSATSLNDGGVIVGRALSPDSQPIAYMLAILGPALTAEKGLSIATSLEPAIDTVAKASEAAANADSPSALATILADLRQARSMLTPADGETTLNGVRSGQASHLLLSARNLLLYGSGNSTLLAAPDRDIAGSIVTDAQKLLQ
jgi:probable HAF family extracellular repeat protein